MLGNVPVEAYQGKDARKRRQLDKRKSRQRQTPGDGAERRPQAPARHTLTLRGSNVECNNDLCFLLPRLIRERSHGYHLSSGGGERWGRECGGMKAVSTLHTFEMGA